MTSITTRSALALAILVLASAPVRQASAGGATTPRGPAAPATPVDRKAYVDASVAQLRESLDLRPAQAAEWEAFEFAYRAALDEKTVDAARSEGFLDDVREGLARDRRAVSLLEGLLKAATPFVASLDARQRARFDAVAARYDRAVAPPASGPRGPRGNPMPPPMKAD